MPKEFAIEIQIRYLVNECNACPETDRTVESPIGKDLPAHVFEFEHRSFDAVDLTDD
jgi:hypothetical protein